MTLQMLLHGALDFGIKAAAPRDCGTRPGGTLTQLYRTKQNKSFSVDILLQTV